MKTYWVYILSNKPRGVLYIGVTSNLEKRIAEHKAKIVAGFSKRYNLDKLVYAEECNDVHAALQREKNLKHWIRDWKIQLIESTNPQWDDLAETLDPRVTAFGRPEDDKKNHMNTYLEGVV